MLTIPPPLLIAVDLAIVLVDLPGAREVLPSHDVLEGTPRLFQAMPRGPCLPVFGYCTVLTNAPTVFLAFRVSPSGMCFDSVGSALSVALTNPGTQGADAPKPGLKRKCAWHRSHHASLEGTKYAQ